MMYAQYLIDTVVCEPLCKMFTFSFVAVNRWFTRNRVSGDRALVNVAQSTSLVVNLCFIDKYLSLHYFVFLYGSRCVLTAEQQTRLQDVYSQTDFRFWTDIINGTLRFKATVFHVFHWHLNKVSTLFCNVMSDCEWMTERLQLTLHFKVKVQKT